MIKNFFKKHFTKKDLLNLLIFIAYSFLLVFIIEWISRGSSSDSYNFLHHHFSKFTYNILIIMLTLSPCFLFKRRTFAFIFVSILWIILSVANNLVFKFRETPLTYADLGMIKNAVELSSQYISNNLMILIITIFTLLLLMLAFLFFKCKKTKVKYKRNIVLLLGFLLTFSISINLGLKSNIITTNFWDVNWGYNTYGFSYSFYNSAVNSGISKPTGYSRNKIANIKDNLAILNSESLNVSANSTSLSDINTSSDNYDSLVKPNIIIIQLESFINPNWLVNLEFNQNPVSNFDYLTKNYSSGLFTVPSMGGGTANTEFEVITGMSTEFFGVGEFPYNTIASKSPIPSLAYTLKDLGYSANSLHNHEGKFYSRDLVYQNLGFDSFTPLELMTIPEKTPVGWAKDSVLINEITDIISSTDTPDLIFGISVQGHGNYPNEPLDNKEIYITNYFDDINKNSLEYYINQMYEMDIFVSDLIDAVNNLNEPSVIVFYGDHFPAVGITQNDVSVNNLKQTPYVIWDNMNLDKTNKDISAYELSSLLVDKLSFPNTTLSMLHNSDLDAATKKEYLNHLEYDMIYGKNYTADYSKLTPSTNYKIGFKNITINSIDILDDSINIIGSSFNTFSRVFVNNKEVPSNLIDENTLSISKDYCSNGDLIKVSQAAASSSVFFSSSNELEFNE